MLLLVFGLAVLVADLFFVVVLADPENNPTGAWTVVAYMIGLGFIIGGAIGEFITRPDRITEAMTKKHRKDVLKALGQHVSGSYGKGLVLTCNVPRDNSLSQAAYAKVRELARHFSAAGIDPLVVLGGDGKDIVPNELSELAAWCVSRQEVLYVLNLNYTAAGNGGYYKNWHLYGAQQVREIMYHSVSDHESGQETFERICDEIPLAEPKIGKKI